MRVLFLNLMHYFLGGQERVVLEELEMLRGHGHEVAVITMRTPYTLDDSIPKYFLEPDHVDALKFAGQTAGIPTKLNYFFSGFHNRQSARLMEEVIQDFKPDIIHSHSYNRYFTPSVFNVAYQYKIPIVTTEHDHKLTCPAYFLLKGWETYCREELCLLGNYTHCITHRCFEKSLLKSSYYALELFINRPRYLKRIHKIVVPSHYLYDVLMRSGISRDQLVFIPNFVDIHTITPHYEEEGFYLYFGRLSPEKGLLTLLKAFKNLKSLTLKIIGKGEFEPEIQQFIQANNCSHIQLCGYKTGQELVTMIQKSKAVIMPSECAENAPMSILEAMACGKIVMGTKIGGIPELLTYQQESFLFTPGNDKELQDLIQHIEALPLHVLQEYGRHNRSVIEKKYSINSHYHTLLTVYTSLCS